MKINLVTTPILDSFSSKSENLIVGKWCLQELENTKKKIKNFRVTLPLGK